jgi:hypothetical protein
MLEFSNVNFDAMEGVKVIRIADGFHADFTHQTVIDGGLVPASISVPSLRLVDATLLVRGNTLDSIQAKILSISETMRDAGVAKLFTRVTKETYFLAKCTGFTDPEYSGLSATIVVSFTCVDYRPYDAITNEPTQTLVGSKISNFTFAGKHCLNDLGCLFVEDNRTATPNVYAHAYVMPGRSGTVRYDKELPDLEEKRINGTLYFVNVANQHSAIEAQDIDNKLHQLSSFFAYSGRADLVFDSDITRKHEAEVILQSAFTKESWNNGMIRIVFNVQPLAKDVTESIKTVAASLTANDVVSFDFSDLFLRGIGWETPVTLEIKNTGITAINELTIYYKNHRGYEVDCLFRGNGFIIPADGTLVLNSDKDNFEAKVGTTNVIPSLVSGNLPALYPQNVDPGIKLKSTFATSVSVKITANGRWV